MKTTLQFSQTMNGVHFIENQTGKIQIDLNALTLEETRMLINGLGNILSGLSACMWRAAQCHGDTRLCDIDTKTQP